MEEVLTRTREKLCDKLTYLTASTDHFLSTLLPSDTNDNPDLKLLRKVLRRFEKTVDHRISVLFLDILDAIDDAKSEFQKTSVLNQISEGNFNALIKRSLITKSEAVEEEGDRSLCSGDATSMVMTEKNSQKLDNTSKAEDDSEKSHKKVDKRHRPPLTCPYCQNLFKGQGKCLHASWLEPIRFILRSFFFNDNANQRPPRI